MGVTCASTEEAVSSSLWTISIWGEDAVGVSPSTDEEEAAEEDAEEAMDTFSTSTLCSDMDEVDDRDSESDAPSSSEEE